MICALTYYAWIYLLAIVILAGWTRNMAFVRIILILMYRTFWILFYILCIVILIFFFYSLIFFTDSGSLRWCLYAGWWKEMESVATYAKTQLPYRVCLGNRQQFNYHHRRYNRKASSEQKDDPGRGGVSISFRLTGMTLSYH